MLNDTRAAGYARQRGIQLTAGDTEKEGWPGSLLPQLTGPQRRRFLHKQDARSVHAHERGVRCLRCKPAPAVPKPAVWRKADKDLLGQL